MTSSEGGSFEMVIRNVSVAVFHSKPKVLVQPCSEPEMGCTSLDSRNNLEYILLARIPLSECETTTREKILELSLESDCSLDIISTSQTVVNVGCLVNYFSGQWASSIAFCFTAMLAAKQDAETSSENPSKSRLAQISKQNDENLDQI